MRKVYINNDNYLIIEELQNDLTDAYIADATATVTLTDTLTAAEVSGATWPLAMTYISGTVGSYSVLLADTLSLTAGRNYTATIAVTGDGLVADVAWPVVAATRKVG